MMDGCSPISNATIYLCINFGVKSILMMTMLAIILAYVTVKAY
jgi:hypothetical protein